MGTSCIASTPNEIYSSYLNKIDPGKLKELWETTKLYKIKQIYENHAQPQQENLKKTVIPFSSFKQMFPELQKYQQGQIHKKRLFQIFDFQNKGFLDWNNFFTSISICYFAPQQILSLFMFILFDEALTKQLTKDQVNLMIEMNEFVVKKNQDIISQQQLQMVVDQIMDKKQYLTIDKWLSVSKQYFDFHKYRRLFNIFKEQKLQKQLILNFNDWNDLYSQKQEKYVSYVVSYKWFQIWKLYVQDHYGVQISLNTLKSNTVKSLKSKKSVHKREVKTQKRIGSMKTIKFIENNSKNKLQKSKKNQNQHINSQKNIDFIHNNIGNRPKEIFNTVLQGQYEEVMKVDLVENRDYVLISQKVWESLRQIYGGGPQFRRTGYDQIELYPKIVKIYSSLFNNQIDFSSQIMREVPSQLTVQQLLTLSIQIPFQDLKSKSFYYKTIGMPKWQQIDNLDSMFSQLSDQIVIFLIYLDIFQDQKFKKNHLKIPHNINEINPGDLLSFTDPNTLIQKEAVFMGKNVQGKYIIHFPKQSYSLDKCMIEQQALKFCKLIQQKPHQISNKMSRKVQIQIKGIPNFKNMGFISSTILNLSNNPYLKNMIVIFGQNHDFSTVRYLHKIYSLLSSKVKIDPKDISQMVKICFPKLKNFQISLSQEFLREFYSQVVQELNSKNMSQDFLQNVTIGMKSSKKCMKCLNQIADDHKEYFLDLQLPKQKEFLFQITFVPISTGLKSTQIKKYGIMLPLTATLKQLQQEFEKKVQIDSKRPYILAEVYSNRIVKNYHQASLDATLNKLKLRNTDTLYAFELYVNFDKFISDHYPASKDISFKQVKVDSFVDCKHPEKGWVFGKVCQIQYLPYTQQTLIKILHKFSKDQQWQIKYDFTQENIGKYPTKCYFNAQQYHLQSIQRYFNESVNQMQICNIPLVISLTSWMRWREFNYLIFLQLKRFIHQNYQFQDLDEQNVEDLEKMQLISTKQIKSSKKIVVNFKKSKFKDYLHGQSFPYAVHLTDTQGRCAICFKFVKNKIFKGQTETYCLGCPLSQSEPISWQIKVADVMVCIDWKGFGFWRTDAVREHSSLINLISSKKNEVIDLRDCLNSKFEPKFEQQELLCCNRPELVQNKSCIKSLPQTVPIYLSRMIRQQDGYRSINTMPISFPLKDLKLNGQKYSLVGMTAIQGKSVNRDNQGYVPISKETNGTVKSDEWVEFDGQNARIASEKTVLSACALVLYYRKEIQ